MSRKVKKITVDMNQDQLPQDLERYRQRALELGGDINPPTMGKLSRRPGKNNPGRGSNPH